MVGSKRGSFTLFVHVVMILMVIVCLYPFALMIMSSVTSESSIVQFGYNLIPKEFGFEAYDYLLKRPMLITRSYGVTLMATAVGTVTGLFMSIFWPMGFL